MKDRAVSETKQRLLHAGQQLFHTQGYAGTGLKQLSQAAEAPWGSLYHFFPDGKDRLGAEIVAYAGELYRAACRPPLNDTRIRRRRSNAFSSARPNPREERLQERLPHRLSHAGRRQHQRKPARRLCERLSRLARDDCARAVVPGAPADGATALAGFVLSCLEGAIVLSRAAKSPAPLLQSAKLVRRTLDREAETWNRARKASRKRS